MASSPELCPRIYSDGQPYENDEGDTIIFSMCGFGLRDIGSDVQGSW